MSRKAWILGVFFSVFLGGCLGTQNDATEQSMTQAEQNSTEETAMPPADADSSEGAAEESTLYESEDETDDLEVGKEVDVICYQGQRYYGMAFFVTDNIVGELSQYESLGTVQGYENSVFVDQEMYTNIPGVLVGGEAYYGEIEGCENYGPCFILPKGDGHTILIAYVTTEMPEWLSQD